MHLTTQEVQSFEVGIRSSLREIDTELRRQGLLRSHEYVRDREFSRHILPLGLKAPSDVYQFLADLDIDNQKKTFFATGCHKAHGIRAFLKHAPEGIPEFDWVLVAVARSRRTCCGCHETGSFY